MQVTPEVKILTHTQIPEIISYLASRQCYSEDFILDRYKIINHSIFDNKANSIISDNKISELLTIVYNSGHHSIYEHVNFTFAINNVSRAASHQLVRHRIASYSQQSLRYVTLNDIDYYIPPTINKNEKMKDKFIKLQNLIQDTYKEFIDNDIKAEDARYILTTATTSDIVCTFNVRSLINFFGERLCSRAQFEIRQVATQMLNLVKPVFPMVFNEIGPKCFQLGYCNETKYSCGKRPKKEDFLKNKIESNND